ncbi:transposase [Aquimarina gracilis]|uniref:Transposase n=1 Tax=Aquimarina gracilis TaxID=874422 RepID=A0ABU5ZYP9_9FLAO|nr:transposase [Aquimarina gracilis]MEB3347034.1 transposase [Aquimarina gracilis]
MKYQTLTPDAYFHIYNRGNNKEDIFKEKRNYNYFLTLLEKHILEVCDIYAYCLLKNHFHLVVKTKPNYTEKFISTKFSNLFNAYSKAINKGYNREGSLFRNPFSRKKIGNENYLKQLIIYTHVNPEHHGMVDDFRTYPHSSYASYLSNKPSKLKRAFILSLFDDISNFKHAHLDKRIKLKDDLMLE